MTGRSCTDPTCRNAAEHEGGERRRGCVHHSAYGSDVPDRHDATSGGEH